MIELSNADIAAEKALAKAIANVGIIPAIRDANLTRQSGNYGRRLIKLQEELGEHAEAYLNVTSAGNGKGKTWDDVREEAADILIVAVDVALTPRPDTYETIEVVEKELVQSLKDYTFNQRQFSHALTSTYADYEALTLKVGAFVGAIGAKFAERGMSKAAAFELVETALTLVETTTAGATPAFIKAHRRKVFRCSVVTLGNHVNDRTIRARDASLQVPMYTR